MINWHRLRFFIPWPAGAAWTRLAELKKSPEFRFSRFDVFLPSRDCDRLVICLGQMHAVLSPRGIWWWTGRRIAAVQARLFGYYLFFTDRWQLHKIGEEGLAHAGPGPAPLFAARQADRAAAPADRAAALAALRAAARSWLANLRAGSPAAIAESAGRLSGSWLASCARPELRLYPIESAGPYESVRAAIEPLERELSQLEKQPDFVAARRKKFRKLNRAEYETAKQYFAANKKFAAVLASDSRDRAHLAIAAAEAERAGVAVFTMGVAHRANQKRLAPQILGSRNIGWIFITPPELWLWAAAVRWLAVGLVLAGLLGAALYFS